jgi:hypothetical protein
VSRSKLKASRRADSRATVPGVRRFLKATLFLTAALVAAVAFYVTVTLPPASRQLTPALPPNLVLGGYHIHSNRSDGSGSVDQIAAAAARAGLVFIVLTDHGDGTRAPDPPVYRNGVLCIDAVEVNTLGGHVVAMGLAAAAPYPLAGETADVIEDVHRFGGWAVAAHPDSPKPDLRWTARDAPYDAIEWLNVDSEWRDNGVRQLVGAAVRSFLRPSEAVVSLFERPVRTLQRWDSAMVARPVVSLAAVDAHAHGLLGWTDTEEKQARVFLSRPSYEHLFRALAQVVVLQAPPSGDARTDAARVLEALAVGRSFSIVRGIASPASLEFSAQQNGSEFAMGDRTLTAGSAGTIRAIVPQAPAARVELLHNGRPLATGQGSATYSGVITEGGYRVEVFYEGFSVPWIVSNPIYAGDATETPITPEPAPATPTFDVPQPDQGWGIEHEPSSTGAWAKDRDAIRFTYRLGPGKPAGQFAALASTISGNQGVDRVEFTARAGAPVRLSVQVRLPGGQTGNRWRRSVYVDQTPRKFVLRLRDFESAERPTSLRPFVARVQSVLFVIDTLNTTPGSEGTIWISGVKLGIGGE